MPKLEYQTAGESHGPTLVCTITGLPAGLPLDMDLINGELSRRQGGYGRGGRMRIETDRVEVLSGLKGGVTLGSPLALLVRNKDAVIERLLLLLLANTPGGPVAVEHRHGQVHQDDVIAALAPALHRLIAIIGDIAGTAQLIEHRLADELVDRVVFHQQQVQAQAGRFIARLGTT